jgi:hypothetical protein
MYYNYNDMVFALNQYLAMGLKTNPNNTIVVILQNFVWIEKKAANMKIERLFIWKYCALIQSIDGARFYYSCHIC